jgi:hypothetical protein
MFPHKQHHRTKAPSLSTIVATNTTKPTQAQICLGTHTPSLPLDSGQYPLVHGKGRADVTAATGLRGRFGKLKAVGTHTPVPLRANFLLLVRCSARISLSWAMCFFLLSRSIILKSVHSCLCTPCLAPCTVCYDRETRGPGRKGLNTAVCF